MLLYTLTQPQRFVGGRDSLNMQLAAKVLPGQGSASLVATAASVVAVIRSDPTYIDEFQRVKSMLDDYVVADLPVPFITRIVSRREPDNLCFTPPSRVADASSCACGPPNGTSTTGVPATVETKPNKIKQQFKIYQPCCIRASNDTPGPQNQRSVC